MVIQNFIMNDIKIEILPIMDWLYDYIERVRQLVYDPKRKKAYYRLPDNTDELMRFSSNNAKNGYVVSMHRAHDNDESLSNLIRNNILDMGAIQFSENTPNMFFVTSKSIATMIKLKLDGTSSNEYKINEDR